MHEHAGCALRALRGAVRDRKNSVNQNHQGDYSEWPWPGPRATSYAIINRQELSFDRLIMAGTLHPRRSYQTPAFYWTNLRRVFNTGVINRALIWDAGDKAMGQLRLFRSLYL